MANLAKRIKVAVGVITKNDLFFVCRRQAHQHQGNKWEFPGGKVNANESSENALKRELAEEIGIEVTGYQHLMDINFSYPDKNVSLLVYIVDEFTGTAYGAEQQESQWVCFDTLKTLEFPDANKRIIDAIAENIQ